MEYLVMMSRERHQRLLEEAARDRLIKQAKMYRKQNMPVKPGIRNRLMISIGEMMVKIGYQIKDRFDTVHCADTDFYQGFDKKKCA